MSQEVGEAILSRAELLQPLDPPDFSAPRLFRFFRRRRLERRLQAAYNMGHALGRFVWEASYQTYLADHDELTGLLNRRGFSKQAQLELGENPNTPYALFYLDLGNFKSVNEQHGHDYGDKTLVKVAALLRGEDITGVQSRHGGDEFIALVSLQPRSNNDLSPEERIGIISQRLFEDGIKLSQNNPGLGEINFSIAVGGVVYDQLLSVSENIDAADKILHQRKAELRQLFSLNENDF